MGFDPGTRAGLAVIDTFGRVVLITSKSNTSIAAFANMILRHGKAIIIASDRRPLPKNVEKLAKSLGAKIYLPPESLSIHEKIELVKKHDVKTKNDHERDAAAAALKAYKHYVGLLRKINTSLNSLGLSNIYNTVVESMIFGYADNLDEAINNALSNKTETKKEEKIIIKKIERPSDVKRLEKDIEVLKRYNSKLLEEIKRLKEQRQKVRIVKDKSDLMQLKENIELLKKMRRLELEGKIPVIKIDDLSLLNLDSLNEKVDLKQRVVLVNDKNLQNLNNYDIKAVISFTEVDRSKLDFPVIIIRESDIKEKDGIKYIDNAILEEGIKLARKTGLIEWVKDYRKRRI